MRRIEHRRRANSGGDPVHRGAQSARRRGQDSRRERRARAGYRRKSADHRGERRKAIFRRRFTHSDDTFAAPFRDLPLATLAPIFPALSLLGRVSTSAPPTNPVLSRLGRGSTSARPTNPVLSLLGRGRERSEPGEGPTGRVCEPEFNFAPHPAITLALATSAHRPSPNLSLTGRGFRTGRWKNIACAIPPVLSLKRKGSRTGGDSTRRRGSDIASAPITASRPSGRRGFSPPPPRSDRFPAPHRSIAPPRPPPD
jgi:hypothetical protein